MSCRQRLGRALSWMGLCCLALCSGCGLLLVPEAPTVQAAGSERLEPTALASPSILVGSTNYTTAGVDIVVTVNPKAFGGVQVKVQFWPTEKPTVKSVTEGLTVTARGTFTVPVTGLVDGTEYTAQIMLSYDDGVVEGQQLIFDTLPKAALSVEKPVSAQATQTVLQGTVLPLPPQKVVPSSVAATLVNRAFFKYALATVDLAASSCEQAGVSCVDAGSVVGVKAATVTKTVHGLKPNTTYSVQLLTRVEGEEALAASPVVRFTTEPLPKARKVDGPAVTPPPEPVTQESTATLQISGSELQLVEQGVVLELSCAAVKGEQCSGQLRLYATGVAPQRSKGRAQAKGRDGGRKRRVLVGELPFTVSGASGVLTVPLNKRGRQLLASGKLKLLTATVTSGSDEVMLSRSLRLSQRSARTKPQSLL